ncbi:PrsW family glutamic-type intramembrane protease, partial [Agromyces sp. ZXT2-6]|uniref:PrsW family glutamic-type intramembrane protease n=1 Tax=Agromyces sp. ZXT2-6 TaxID=3461153 RepID=UPI004054FF28
MSAETSTRSGEQATGTAGALDVLLQRARAVAARVTRRIPKPILIAAVSAVLLLSVVVTMINSADPMSTIILLIAFFLSIVQGLILVRTRTLSVRTLMVIAAVGISAVSTAVVITTSGLAALFDYAVLRGPFPSIDPWVSGFWTPIVEEFFKLLPLLVILAWSQRARTMTVGDCVLVGLMSGIGFALIEEIARSGAQDCDYLPGILMFPTGIAPCGSLEWSFTHAAATAVIAAAVGLWWRAHRRREHAVLFGVLSWLVGAWIVIGHMAVNMQESRQGGIGDPWEPLIEAVGVTAAMPYLFLLTLVIAAAVDYRDLAAAGATPRILLPSLAGTTWRERLASFRDQRWRRLAKVRAAYRVEGSADVWTHRQLLRLGLLGLPFLLLAGWISLRAPGADAACLLCSWDPGDALPGVAGGAAGGAAAAGGGGSKPPPGEEKGKEKPKPKPKEEPKPKPKPKEEPKPKPKEEPKPKPKEEPKPKPKE